MQKYVGQSVKRKEDYRLLTGTGKYVADLHVEGMVEAVVMRSTYAHAIIKSIDTSEALAMEGVFAVITAHDIEGEVEPFTRFVDYEETPPELEELIHPVVKLCPEDVLAKDKVFYVGQPVVVVVATDRYTAEDAAALVHIEYETLPVVSDPYEALEADSPVLHPHLEGNVQAHYHMKLGKVDEVFANAKNTLKTRFKTPRIHANPMETRGVLATFDTRNQFLQVWSSTQMAFLVRTHLSEMLHMAEENIRVTAPEVGGGFGPKVSVYPEEIVIPYLAMKLKRPVRWIEDRIEHLQSTRHSRDQIHDVEVAFADDGTILAIRDHFVMDAGAFNPFALTCAYNTAAHLRGNFVVENYEIGCRCVMTNKTPNVPYRGAGRPEGVFVMDRLLDMVAGELGMDPVDVRFKNIIQADQMPYPQGMLYRDGNPVVYDSGDYPTGLKMALDLSEYKEFREQQKEWRKQGRNIGIGISSYIEGTGIGPHEGALIRLDASGQIMAYVGSTPHGQSHETTLAQVCADEFGVSPEMVTVRAGDTGLLPYGGGTFASRGAVTAGTAVHMASKRLNEKMLAIAGEMLEVGAADLEMRDGKVYAKAYPERAVTFRQIALAAAPGPHSRLPKGMDPGVEATYYFVPPTVTYSSGFHIALIEVDKETGFIDVLKYTMVHDCGLVLNPMVVEGQIQGGFAQGLGAAIYEEIVYDKSGQLLTGTFMDYLLPTSMEVPDLIHGHQEFLSTRNPMGIKGVGEGGTISPPAAIANAVIDALRPLKINVQQLPLSPDYVRRLIVEAEASQTVEA
jgi:carbon-monoxide dehydrogenase large subunit